MAEKKTEVIVYRVDYHCDECGELMEWTDIELTVYPSLYPHKCKSGHTKNFLMIYPFNRYEVKKNLSE